MLLIVNLPMWAEAQTFGLYLWKRSDRLLKGMFDLYFIIPHWSPSFEPGKLGIVVFPLPGFRQSILIRQLHHRRPECAT